MCSVAGAFVSCGLVTFDAPSFGGWVGHKVDKRCGLHPRVDDVESG